MAMAFAPESEGRSRTPAMVHGEVVGDAQVPLPRCRSRRRYSRARCHKEVDIQVIQSERRLGYTQTLWAIARTWAPCKECTRRGDRHHLPLAPTT